MTDNTVANEQELDENELIAQRKQRLAELRKKGEAYPNQFRRDSLSAEIHANFDDKDKAEKAAEALNQEYLLGRSLKIRLAEPKPQRREGQSER